MKLEPITLPTGPSASLTAVERDQLIENTMAYAKHLARRQFGRLSPGSGVDLYDLQCAALLGLTQAGHRYDPSKNPNFKQYATPRIRGEIIAEIRRADPLNQTARVERSRLQRSDPCNLTPKERYELGILESRSITITTGALAITDRRTNNSTEFDVEDQRAPDHCDTIAKQDASRFIVQCIDQMKERERTVLLGKLLEGRTLADMATELGFSESYVCRIFGKAMDHLRRRIGEIDT